MRKRFIQDPVTLKLIPADEYQRVDPDAPFIMPDIAPYQSMKTGEIIMGRRQHREHLRQHGMIEVGNEKPKATSRGYEPDRERVKADVYRAFQQHGY